MTASTETHPAPQPGQDALRPVRNRHPLDALFRPRAVAVIDGTEGAAAFGRTLVLLQNLGANPFGGTVYPIHPTRRSILGRETWPSIAAVPEPVDLALLTTPQDAVPAVIGECAATGVGAAIIASTGGRPCGAGGAEWRRQVLDRARRGDHRVRVVGPDSLGVAVPSTGFNSTFANAAPAPGSVAFLSQSGSLGTAVLGWSVRERVGFSAFVSVGSMLDVGWGDLIDYLGDDPNTKAIAIYMESIGDARSFLSAAREFALAKPIIVVKAGRTEAGARAVAARTGCEIGSDAVVDAAFRRAGVLRVNSIAELFNMVEVLGLQPRPRGPRLAIVSNAGGPAVLATDALIAAGGDLAELSPQTVAELDKILPPHWSHGDPVDVLGDADPHRFATAADLVARDEGTDGLLAVLTPQAMTEPKATAARLHALVKGCGKPVLASWMGGADVAAGRKVLQDAGIPSFEYPDDAARAFQYMSRYSLGLQSLYEKVAVPPGTEAEADAGRARAIIDARRTAGGATLSEHDSKQVLEAYGIPSVETRVAASEDHALREADALGYPVVLKLHSETLVHKSDVGGIRLNLQNAAAVQEAYRSIEASVAEQAGPGHFLGVTVQPMVLHDGYELVLGSNVEPQFGPVLLFGLAGQLARGFEDYALGLPPLTPTLARRMMEQTRIYRALAGVRGQKPVDLSALDQLIVRFSQLAVEQRWIKEIVVNPLVTSGGRLLALDARVILHEHGTPEDRLPRPTIRPYPGQYMWLWKADDGIEVTIRPIRPQDEQLMVRFHEGLSASTLHYRYGGVMKLAHRAAHAHLVRTCFTDYDRQIALVADRADPATGRHEILGLCRLVKECGEDGSSGELTLVVADRWQNRGLGTRLLEAAVQVARGEELKRLYVRVAPENFAMLRVCERAGLRLHREGDGEGGDWIAETVP